MREIESGGGSRRDAHEEGYVGRRGDMHTLMDVIVLHQSPEVEQQLQNMSRGDGIV